MREFATATDNEVRDVIDRSHRAFLSWRETPLQERAAIVRKVGSVFLDREEELSEIITREMGKKILESRGEIALVESIFTYYADNAATLLADEHVQIAGGTSLVQKRPVGSILGIMPWNFPYYQVARFAAPNLVLGNTVILKHAENCPESSAAVESVLRDAGLPKDAYINVYATPTQIEWALADPRVQGVSLTGSERAGSAVAATAGKNLKKTVLELGGSDPMVVLDTDDIGAVARTAAESRLYNVGQACNAPKRMIVLADIYDQFVTELVDQFQKYVPGDPLDPATTLAPLSSDNAATALIGQIEKAVADGATLHTGGYRIDRPGSYIQPAVITDVTPAMDAYREELFGPVAVVFRATDEDEAVQLANDTEFGLGSSVFSSDPERARRVADRIEAGMTFINQAGGSQADLPFGGIKRSGIGRELGNLGLDEFMNKKIVRL